MKTIRLFGLIMLTALVFSGCSKSDDDNSEKMSAKYPSMNNHNLSGKGDYLACSSVAQMLFLETTTQQ